MSTNVSAIPTRGIPGWVIRVRAPFMTATVIPVLLGGAVAWVATGAFSWLHFLLSLGGALLLHAGANMLNDYFDHLSGTDRHNRQAIAPFTGGSPMLKLGLLKPERVRNEGLAYFAIAALIGCYLAWQSSFWLLAIGAAGLFAGYLYTAYLAPSGWGELFLFLSFGPLMVLGTWVVQTGAPSWEPIWASLPIACLIMNVLWINQFPDAPADDAVGKRHWVVRLGRERALPIYGLLFVAAYLSLVVNVLTSLAPPWTLAGLLTIPLAWRAWKVARTHYDEMPALRPANELTIQVHLVTGVLLIVGYLIQGIVR